MGLRGNIGGIRLGVFLAHQWRGLGREWLCRPCLFALQIRSGNRTFLDWPKRFTGFAVEDKQQTVLRSLSHRIDLFPLVGDSQQYRRTRKVFVQQVMVHDLKVPNAFSGCRIQGKHSVGEQVRPVPPTTIEIRLGSLGRHIDDATLFIKRLAAPRHQARRGLVGILGPSVVAYFARTWNQMKDPPPFTRANVVSTHSALAPHTTDDHEILVHHTGRVQARAELDRSIVPKVLDHLAGHRIQGEKHPGHPGQQAPLASHLILPIDQAALPGAPCPRTILGRIPSPEHLTGRSVQCYHLARWRRCVKNPIDDQIIRLILRLVPGFKSPCNLQLRHVVPVNLLQRRVQVALFAPEIHPPIDIRCRNTPHPQY